MNIGWKEEHVYNTIFKVFFFMCVYVCVYVPVWVHVYKVLVEARRGHWITRNWSYMKL